MTFCPRLLRLLPVLCLPFAVAAQSARIQVNAAQILHPISPWLTGACIEDVNHEIYGGLYSQMIFGESFQEPATPEAPSGFTEYGGGWTITNGVLFSASGPGPKLIANAASVSSGDIKVQALLPSSQGGDAGFIFQVTQAGLGADVFTGYEVSLAPAGNLTLGRHRQNWEFISQTPCSVPVGQWISLEVKYTNASLTVLVNGAVVVQYTDTQYPLVSGSVGLRNYQQDTQFKNLQINGVDVAFVYDAANWPGAISGMWAPATDPSASGQCSVESSNVFVGSQSQRISYNGGSGSFGIANRGLNHWGMNFVSAKEYEGCVDVRADSPTPFTVALQSADGSVTYAQTNLLVSSNIWQQVKFTLTPSASDPSGRFAISLTQPGSVVIGYAFLSPGAWGRFAGLPVRNDLAQGLINQGVTVLRYGGSMVNAAAYRWKNMIGPRDGRPPYNGTWYPYSTDGWGILDFLNFCEAAGFLGVPDFNINEAPQDMADFMQYVNGATNTTWGARRAADGHPQPYNLKYIELGNEERVDANYYQKFQALAQAIWAADSNITLVVGDFTYSQVIINPFNFHGADSGITSLSAQQQIVQLAHQHNCAVWFDLHVWDDGPAVQPSLPGMFSYIDALTQIAGGADFKIVVFELNANHHDQGRALGNALAMNAAERDGRLPIMTSANCLQPDGQNDNGWDQGLLFLNPSQVWLQPPGYVTQMYSQNYQPLEIRSHVADPSGGLDAAASRSSDGSRLFLKVVNASAAGIPTAINLANFAPTNPLASVQTLAAALADVNTAQSPNHAAPVIANWPHGFSNNAVNYIFPPYSVTTISFQGKSTAQPAPALKHRYSFNEAAGSTIFKDSVGSANGVINGLAHLDGARLALPGGKSPNNNNFASLPAGLLNGFTSLTLEFWVSFGANSQWGRLVDFGLTDSSGNGAYCLDFTPHSGNSPGGVNFEVSDADPGFNNAQEAAGPPILDNLGNLHLVLVYDPSSDMLSVYTNGVLMAANAAATIPLSAIQDAHCYLGKSSYASDANGVANVDEFRIYNGAMAAAQVQADYGAGPNTFPASALVLTAAQNQRSIVLTWPALGSGPSIQTSPIIGPGAAWTTLSAALTSNGYQLALPATGETAFYRLGY